MSSRLTLLLLLLVLLGLLLRENLADRPGQLHQLTDGRIDMCLACHQQERLDPAHDAKVLGCAVCHLGDGLATDKRKAHAGMVKNPGDLRVVDRTCGLESCHAIDVPKLKNALMATNRGILATMRYYWGESPDRNGDLGVEELLKTGQNSLALDYYRKLCGTCHLWKARNDLPNEPAYLSVNEKGGGCTACHFVRPQPRPGEDPARLHPLTSKKVPTENCVRCHNRSGRIGTSYQGIYESEGYGAPLRQGVRAGKKLPDGRFVLELEDDIHHRQGLACIDCHTREEIMGDGSRYAHYEEQLEISCATCHSSKPGTTRRNRRLNNLVQEEGKFLLVSKLDGKKHPLHRPKRGSCDYPGHHRLTCESCHSSWAPQCFGCHVKLDKRETHLDKLTGQETPGWWQEGRTSLRFEQPTLAVWGGEVVIVTPGCQDIVTVIGTDGKPEKQFNSLTMAALNPHTIQKGSRTCVDCHTSGKSVGLGEGTLWREEGQWRFTPQSQGLETGAGPTPPLDAYVDLSGKPLQKSARADLRPFNGEELRRILRVGLCLECHRELNDPAWRGYRPTTTCPVYREQGSGSSDARARPG